MAKTSKKKVGKKSRKPAEATHEMTTVKPDVDYDDDDEEEEINENITSDEGEEESGEDERKHQKLLEAISSLGGKKKKKLGERSEAAVQMSEFTVNAEGEGDKIDLADLIGAMDKTPAVSNKTKKQLKNLQQSQKPVECPLSKQESQRIQRDVAFQKTAAEVSRWTSIIKQNQRAEQLVFPLSREPPSGPRPLEKVVCGWKARTPLEQEIFGLLSANKQPAVDPVLTPKEEASLRAMSLDEAKIRRAELQKARALQSYYEAKAKRARRIKSKKYHRVQNKAKRKELLRRFDETARTDPAAALEELSRMELTRMRERMSLKHQNSGKWARAKAIMAKYDEGARRAMQEQLEVNKELTRKVVTSLNEEEEEEEEEDAEVLPDFVNDAEAGPDPANPWMRGKLSAEPAENETKGRAEPEPAVAAAAAGNTAAAAEEEEGEEEEDEREAEETEEDALLREFDAKRKLRQAQESDKELVICVSDDEEEKEKEKEEEKEEEKEKKEEEEEKNAEAEDPDKEEEELSRFTSLYRGIQSEAAADAGQTDASAPLEEGLLRVRTLEDLELLGLAEEEPVQTHNPPENPPPGPQRAKRKRKRGIDLKEVLTKEAKVLQVPLAQTVEDGEEEEEEEEEQQRGLIKEAFAGDDVISDFLKDKRKQEEAGKPRVVDLTLPGWGEWGGTGLKPSRAKRKRFRTKAAAPPPRKDGGLPAVIVSEATGGGLGAHRVTSLPFPFENPSQFESTIRAPLGRTWNTERTVRKITKPKVVTQLGAIIEPMAREKLMKDKKQTFAVKTVRKNRVDSRKKTKR